jgi:hypothetical protein
MFKDFWLVDLGVFSPVSPAWLMPFRGPSRQFFSNSEMLGFKATRILELSMPRAHAMLFLHPFATDPR